MNIGLDYDGCYTEDPLMWLKIIIMMQRAGHVVHLVTMRYPSEIDDPKDPVDPRIAGVGVRVIATSRQAKDAFCKSLGIKVDVWIDDNPEAIKMNAEDIWGWSTPEGQIVIPVHGKKVSS